MDLISLQNVWLKYVVEFKENKKVTREDFWALRGVSLNLEKGQTLGIIGENGSGKTTLLKIIAGMLSPDRGAVQVNGIVSTLMEIGAGFQKELTGRDNIYLISSFFGFTRDQIDSRYQDIVKFAAIGRFIDAPVKVYSQGMYMRLAFAIAIHVDPDILLIDDMFVVGDIYAQRKCVNKLFELRDLGKTIIFVMHDLEMAKRICSRGVFLRDGEVIKDGPIDKVCGYYNETVGDKKGIVILQKGALSLVFNNGMLIVRWKDKTITSGSSGHSYIWSLGKCYASNIASWQIKNFKPEKEFVAIGRWPDFFGLQYWRISILNEKEFSWEMGIHASEEISIERFQMATMFIDEYRSWFTVAGQKDFPEKFIHPKEWQGWAVSSSVDRAVGIRSNASAGESPPVVIFDRSSDNLAMECRVGNTGSAIGAREITYENHRGSQDADMIQGRKRYFLGKVRIFENEEKEALGKYLAYAKQVIRDSVVIRKGQLSLFCKDRTIEIYWRDMPLTCGVGFNTKFRRSDDEHIYGADAGRWHIHKKSDDEILITISWDDEPLFSQIWRLRLEDDNTIAWQVTLDTDHEIIIVNKETELLINGGYKKWLTQYEEGDFVKLDKGGNVVVLDKYINEHMGVEGVYGLDELSLPGIVFDSKDKIPKASFISRVKDNGTPTTRLRYLDVIAEENGRLSKGSYEYFKGAIRIIDPQDKETALPQNIQQQKPLIMGTTKRRPHTIACDRLALHFDNGKGRLFWDGLEYTKGLGLYSSIFFQDRWYDSTQAFWKIQDLDKDSLVAIGCWAGIPLSQTWRISLLGEKVISWRIEERIWAKVALGREQVNIMLSDRYEKWFVHKRAQGIFPEKFCQHNGIFWDRLWHGAIKSPIGIKKCIIKRGIFKRECLPSLVFKSSDDCRAHHLIVENSDELFRARILQCELDMGKKNEAGGNKHFEGRIELAA
ncbi:ABC transporter ATP-binding protein [Candidatus Omnitrophota bacterium]